MSACLLLVHFVKVAGASSGKSLHKQPWSFLELDWFESMILKFWRKQRSERVRHVKQEAQNESSMSETGEKKHFLPVLASIPSMFLKDLAVF